MNTLPSGPRPSDHFIPWYIVLFFVVQTILFGWLYHVSKASYTGLVTDQAYEKGLRYNETIARAEEQARLGWTCDITKKESGVDVILQDHGRPLTGADVQLWMIRPVHDGMDQKTAMKEVSPGHYAAAITVPEKGLWEVRVEAEKQGRRYQSAKRMEF